MISFSRNKLGNYRNSDRCRMGVRIETVKLVFITSVRDVFSEASERTLEAR